MTTEPARDVDRIIGAVLRARPGVTCERLRVSHPGTDDDGLWFFHLPDAKFDAVQIESPHGTCPFLVEGQWSVELGRIDAVVEQVLRELDAAL